MGGESIIEIPEIRKAMMPMSVDFFHAAGELGWIDENVELLHGYPVKKMSKSPEHEYLVSLLLRMLEQVIPSSHFVIKERPLTTQDSEPEPDLMVVEGEERSFRRVHPTTASLVIEVSIHTQERDRQKARIYAAAGVEEYWLVEPDRKAITVYRAPEPEGYGVEKEALETGMVHSTVFPSFEVGLSEVFS
ncbi:MAG: Uma2 family endonuclease [Verrucomicrobiota bacterium]